MAAPGDLRRHGVLTRRITLALLAIWFVTSFVVPFFARELDFRIAGWSFSYWMAAQGGLLVYCAIATGYALYMNRLDARFGVEDDPG